MTSALSYANENTSTWLKQRKISVFWSEYLEHPFLSPFIRYGTYCMSIFAEMGQNSDEEHPDRSILAGFFFFFVCRIWHYEGSRSMVYVRVTFAMIEKVWHVSKVYPIDLRVDPENWALERVIIALLRCHRPRSQIKCPIHVLYVFVLCCVCV